MLEGVPEGEVPVLEGLSESQVPVLQALPRQGVAVPGHFPGDRPVNPGGRVEIMDRTFCDEI